MDYAKVDGFFITVYNLVLAHEITVVVIPDRKISGITFPHVISEPGQDSDWFTLQLLNNIASHTNQAIRSEWAMLQKVDVVLVDIADVGPQLLVEML